MNRTLAAMETGTALSGYTATALIATIARTVDLLFTGGAYG